MTDAFKRGFTFAEAMMAVVLGIMTLMLIYKVFYKLRAGVGNIENQSIVTQIFSDMREKIRHDIAEAYSLDISGNTLLINASGTYSPPVVYIFDRDQRCITRQSESVTKKFDFSPFFNQKSVFDLRINAGENNSGLHNHSAIIVELVFKFNPQDQLSNLSFNLPRKSRYSDEIDPDALLWPE